ncbi:antibiotic biosynthesis monooxygenase [Halomonas heilongjiangensis]|uniref:Antibiotic biosynthesis monooxygenase n=2 Tax=Halomonas heilongjiangensis TaxID=1387883 RepID=A0A2N7TFU3_9GAMM|nr:antibiotic biosynthesis monooxygenase [Halomonas heilongjiangensis]PXX88138.1 antibiotic biosynthesis monooxygenase [Halomonas heilongjiangensis]
MDQEGNSGVQEYPERKDVTFHVKHCVRPGASARYEAWLREIIKAASDFPGHQGVHILRPQESESNYEIAVRFSSEEDARRWRDSTQRKDLMASIEKDLQEREVIEIHSGIDFWFTPLGSTAKQPSRWKQWLITTAVIWPLTMIVPALWGPVFDILPILGTWGVSHGLVAASIVALVVYLVMPRVVRLVSSWLFR